MIATKFGQKWTIRTRARPENVRQVAENSLRRPRTDRIDLYPLHRPDDEAPIAALDELVQAGKVREIGCSNFSADQLRAARFVSVQNEYSLLRRAPEVEALPKCQ